MREIWKRHRNRGNRISDMTGKSRRFPGNPKITDRPLRYQFSDFRLVWGAIKTAHLGSAWGGPFDLMGSARECPSEICSGKIQHGAAGTFKSPAFYFCLQINISRHERFAVRFTL